MKSGLICYGCQKEFLIKLVRAKGTWALSISKSVLHTLSLRAGLIALFKGVGLGFSFQDALH